MMVQLAVAELVKSVYINVQANMAAGVRRIDMGILFTNGKLSSIHSESVTGSRSKASTYNYAEKEETLPIVRLAQVMFLVISVYLSSLPVVQLSDAPRKRLVVTEDSARIQDETAESSAWFFKVLGV